MTHGEAYSSSFCFLGEMFWFPRSGVGRAQTTGAEGLGQAPWADSASLLNSRQTPDATLRQGCQLHPQWGQPLLGALGRPSNGRQA